MKQTLILTLALIASACSAQSNIAFTAGIVYTNGVPTHQPLSRGSRWAIDTTTFTLYESLNPTSTSWLARGHFLQNTVGCVPPAYTPTKHQSLFAINACDSLYYYRSGAWRHLNKGSAGATWGSITGTLSSQTDLQTALNAKLGTGASFGGDVSGVYSNLQIGAGAVGTIELAAAAVTGAKLSFPMTTTAEVDISSFGDVIINSADAPGGSGGAFLMTAGDGEFGGSFTMTAGSASADEENAGELFFTGGEASGIDATGGGVTGVGGSATGSGGIGGAFSLKGGEGTAAGGQMLITGGKCTDDGNGGKVVITGGPGLGAGNSSGNVEITAGTFSGTTAGIVRITGQVGIGTASPSASASVDITSTTGGLLLPRMTTAQRDAIASAANGLLIYNTTTNKVQARAGGAWVDLH